MQGPVVRRGQTVIQPEHKAKVISCLNVLEAFLDGFEWFSTTENPCIADLSILANFSTIYHAGLDISEYPNIAGWYERCSSLPGFADNEKGAKMFGLMLKSKLTEPF
jgi:glutathione S-transferase